MYGDLLLIIASFLVWSSHDSLKRSLKNMAGFEGGCRRIRRGGGGGVETYSLCFRYRVFTTRTTDSVPSHELKHFFLFFLGGGRSVA